MIDFLFILIESYISDFLKCLNRVDKQNEFCCFSDRSHIESGLGQLVSIAVAAYG